MSSVKTQVGARDLATETRFEPSGDITATNVQQAIEAAATLGVTSWGVITGALSDQTDLQSALDAKLAVTTAATTYQPLDAQLTSLSSASANGVSLVTAADYAAMKALLDLEIGTDVQAYDADLTAWAAVNPSSYSTTAQIAAAYQPLDADLTTIAGLSSADSNFIVGSATGWVVESGATVRTSLGLGTMATETATNYLTTAAAASGYQPLDAELTSLSGASANGVSLVTAANYAAMRTLLDVESGTDFLSPAAIAAAYQPLDGELTAIAGLTSAADKGIQFTGAGTASTYDLTTAGKALLDDADASAQRTTLGLGTLATQSGTFSGTSSGTNTGDQTITLTGAVTGSGTGSFAATIANAAVTLAKMADVATGTVFYRKTAATGVPEVQTLATLKTDLGLTGTNSGDQTITLTGDVTGSGTGSFAATLATVNANTGSWGLAGSVAQFTVNAKGLITAAANVAISVASTAISDATAAGRAMLTAATAAAQTALLDAFVGDSGAGGTKGLVPAPIAGDSAKFLRGDGAFASIPGGGDLLAANNLSDVVNAATARTNLGLAIGTNVQAYDADLATWAGLTPSANAQSLVTAANYAAMRALLDLEANTDFYAPSGTDVALADGGTGASTAEGARASLQAAAFDVGAALGLLTNPFFEISQQNGTTAGAAATAYYPADQWYALESSDAVLSVQNVVDPFSSTSTLRRLKNSIKATATTADGTIAATQYIQPCSQTIEGTFWRSLGWGTADARAVDIVFIAQCSVTGTYPVAITNAAGNRAYCATVSLTANTPAVCMVTIPGDTSGTWVTTTAASAKLFVGAVGGSNFQVSALDTWEATDNFTHSSCTNWAASGTTNFFQVGYCQIFPAGVLPFASAAEITGEALQLLLDMRVPYDIEFQRCARYYYKLDYADIASLRFATSFARSTTLCRCTSNLPVFMRASGTVSSPTLANVQIQSGTGSLTPSAFIAGVNAGNILTLDFTVSGATAGNGGAVVFTDVNTITIDARL